MKYKRLILFIAVMSVLLFTLITTVNIPIIDDFWVLHNVTQIDQATTFNHKLVLLFEPHSMGFGKAFFNQTEHRYVVMKLLMLMQLKLFHCINLRFYTFLSAVTLIASLWFLIKFISKHKQYNKDVIFIISIIYLTPIYFMNLFWMLGFNNHLTIFLGFVSLYFLSNEHNKLFFIGCILLIINLFVSHGGVLFIFISGIYLFFIKKYKKLFVFIIIFILILSIDIYTLNKYSLHHSDNNDVGLKLIFAIFPMAVLLGSIAINIKIALLLGFIFMTIQVYLIKNKYYKKNPEVFCLQIFIFSTCLGLVVSRWQFGANYFLNTRYKYFSVLMIITILLAFYEYYEALFYRCKNILIVVSAIYFLGGNIFVYKLALKRQEKIIVGYNYYLKYKNCGLYVFEENMYDNSNMQNQQAVTIMNNLIINKYMCDF